MNPDQPLQGDPAPDPTPTPQSPDPPLSALTPDSPIPNVPDDRNADSPSAPSQTRRPDRWAHRRAEPRPLALLWTTYLAVATVVMLTSLIAFGGADHDVYRPAARALLAVTAVGIVVLWPMVRLSQVRPPEGPSAAVAKDLIVVLAPVQAVIWPQAFVVLAHWPLEVVAALAAMLAAWGVLIGAVLVVALQAVTGERAAPRGPRRAGAARGVWMLVIIALVASGPLIGLLVGPGTGDPFEEPGRVSAWALTSPVTAVFEIARDRPWSGWPAEARPAHWWTTTIVGGLGLLAWAGALSVGPRRYRPVSTPEPPDVV